MSVIGGRSRICRWTILGVVSPPPDPSGVRISDFDRERAIERLHQALAEGRITVEELEERVAAVYAARYAAELRSPLAELPGDDVVALPATVAPLDAEPVVLRVGAAGIKRSGDWSVPPRLRVKSRIGPVVLDFCDAAIPHSVVEIELLLGTGSAKLLVPDGATVNVDGLVATMGSIKSSVASQAGKEAPHFVVRGRARFGSVTVRRRRGFAGLRF